MTRKLKHGPDNPVQAKRFIEMAREIGAAETKEGADRAFRSVARRSGSEPKPTQKK